MKKSSKPRMHRTQNTIDSGILLASPRPIRTGARLCACLMATGFSYAANNSFLPTTGNWNSDTNWTYGIPTQADTDNVVISAGRTCTIQNETTAAAGRVFVGADNTGTLIVEGSLYTPSDFGIDVGLWNNGHGNGLLIIKDGGQVGAKESRAASIKLGANTSTQGRLEILNGSAYLNNLYALNSTNSTGLGTVELQNGLLDVSGTLCLGYKAGAVSNTWMTVSGSSTVRAGQLQVGRNDNTAAQLTINGSSPVFEISNSILLANESVVDLNFDDNGISPLSASKFWYSHSAIINVNGTTNMLPDTYDLVTGTTGGSIGNTLTFNISGFPDRYLTDVIESTNNGTIRFSLEVKQQHTYDFGACEQQLLWAYESTDPDRLEKQLAHVDAMAEAGAKWIRLTLHTPFSTKAAHIRRCNEKGIKVLLQLSGGRAELYPEGTERRPGSEPPGQPQWPCYRLSDLDLDRAEGFLRDFFDTLTASNATIHAVEMFNEINWNAFNGDLPLVEGGLWIDQNTDWNDPTFTQYRAGIKKVSQLTKTVSELDAEYFSGALDIISCGMVGTYSMDSNWISNVKGGLVTQDLTLQLMHGSHPMQTNATNYLQYIDGIGMHIYPGTVDYSQQTAFDEIVLDLDPTLTVPGAGTTKPFWITECGYARNKFDNETNRFEQLAVFYDALTDYDRPKSAVDTVFHFAFSKECNDSHYVWDNGIFEKSADIFASDASENTTWNRLPFDAWQVEHFGDQAHLETVAGSLTDFDNDGASNLEEYATGSNPTNPEESKTLLIENGQKITYTTRINDPKLDCTLQKTTQLTPAVWEDITNTIPGEIIDEYQRFSIQPNPPTEFYRLYIHRTLDEIN